MTLEMTCSFRQDHTCQSLDGSLSNKVVKGIQASIILLCFLPLDSFGKSNKILYFIFKTPREHSMTFRSDE